MASKSIEQFKQNVTDDRQTDHAMEKCVRIGGIACTARAILPHNTGTSNSGNGGSNVGDNCQLCI